MRVRKLNNLGIERFERYVGELRQGAMDPPPHNLLESEESSSPIHGEAEVEDRPFASRLDAARYFAEALRDVDAAERDHGRGLWAWLSLFYFNRLCPPDRRGLRAPGKSYRHVPSDSWRHFYRHLLLGPYRIHSICGEAGRILLWNEFGSHGDFAEQIGSRQEILTNPGLMQLIDRLYFDTEKGRAKSGAGTQGKPGTLRRLIVLLNQLDLTYDLYALNADELVDLLPAEYAKWLRA